MNYNRSNARLTIYFWLLYFLYEWVGQASVNNEYHRYLINACVIVPIAAMATWVTVEILMKYFFFKNRKTAFWIGFVVSALLFTLIRRYYNYYYVYPVYWPEALKTMSFWFLPKIIIEFVNIYLIVALYTMFCFLRAWYEQERLAQELQRDKAEAQLELLKSQVQPHFIFNTLNNIYSLSLKKSPNTSDLIYRLSSLLSYMLYDSRQTFIPVAKELEYIHNYIELEKIRYGERLDVAVNCFDEVCNFTIPPFLLLPLVENSFKHGVNNDVGNSWIRIDLSVKEDWLTVKIENSRSADAINGHEVYKGIGLVNVKKRLEILCPDRHEFKYMGEGQSFLAILKIKKR